MISPNVPFSSSLNQSLALSATGGAKREPGGRAKDSLGPSRAKVEGRRGEKLPATRRTKTSGIEGGPLRSMNLHSGRRHGQAILALLSSRQRNSLFCHAGTAVHPLTVLLQAADVREDKGADAVAAGDNTNEDAESTSRAIANTTMFMEKFIVL